MTGSKKRSLLKAAIIIGIIAGTFVGSYFILCLALNTDTPFTVVEGSSMEDTLFQGDLLIVGKPRDLGDIQNGSHTEKTGDILIFYAEHAGFLVVHRVIAKNYSGGKWYFNTQGDNPSDGKDNMDLYAYGGAYLPEDFVKGIVIGVIPWIGNIGIFLRDSGAGIFIIIIILAYLLISTIFESKPEEPTDDSAQDEEKTEGSEDQKQND